MTGIIYNFLITTIMKVQLIFKKEKWQHFDKTLLTHIKITKDGRYVKFAKHTNDLLEQIQKQEFDIDESLIF